MHQLCDSSERKCSSRTMAQHTPKMTEVNTNANNISAADPWRWSVPSQMWFRHAFVGFYAAVSISAM
jgi:hypothetical protein